MKELPYFRFYAQEWQNSNVTLLDLKTQGVFINSCIYYWFADCELPMETLHKRLPGCEKELNELIEEGLIYDGDMYIKIEFLDNQWTDLKAYREKKQRAGRKGGLKKASNATAELQQNTSYKEKENDNDNEKEQKKQHAKNLRADRDFSDIIEDDRRSHMQSLL